MPKFVGLVLAAQVAATVFLIDVTWFGRVVWRETYWLFIALAIAAGIACFVEDFRRGR